MIDADVLATLPLTRPLSPATQRAMARHSLVCEYAPGTVLWTAGAQIDYLAVVIDGRVRIAREGLGRQLLVHTEGPGGTLGEVPLFATSPTPVTAVALERTRCLIITRRALESAIALDQQVVWILLRRMAERVRLLVDRLDHMALHNTRVRLAPLVVQVAEDVALRATG